MEYHKEYLESIVLSKENNPDLYDLLLFNDDNLPVSLLTKILHDVFFYSEHIALSLIVSIRNNGFLIVGTYSLDIAQSKQQKAINMGQELGFSLLTKIQYHSE